MLAIQTMALLMLITAREPTLHGFVVEAHFAALAVAIETDNQPGYNRIYAALHAARQHRRLFDFILSRLDSSSHSMQHLLIYGVSDFPERASKAVPQLRRIVGDTRSNYSNRVVATKILGRIKELDQETIEVFRFCLNYTPPPPVPNRGGGIKGLRPLGPLRIDIGAELRCEACVALWKAEKKVASVAPTLLEVLESPWHGDQSTAIKTIGEIGPDLKEAVGPALMKLMYSDVRVEVYPLIPAFAPTKQVAAQE